MHMTILIGRNANVILYVTCRYTKLHTVNVDGIDQAIYNTT